MNSLTLKQSTGAGLEGWGSKYSLINLFVIIRYHSHLFSNLENEHSRCKGEVFFLPFKKKTFLLFSEMFKCLVTTEETHKKVTLNERLRKMGKINKA